MQRNNFFLTIVLGSLLISCATNKPKYRQGEPTTDFGYPHDLPIEKSFYLIGDGGYSPPGGTSEGLLAFEAFLDSVKQQGNYTLFLGDNIYPDGLVEEGHRRREFAEARLDAQVKAVEGYDGELIFIPGNHDWYNQGLKGLKRQEEYLQEKLDRDDIWYPRAGCPLEFIDISEDIQLIIIDSQWYLTNWDNHPEVNRGCEEIKTREALFVELETELKKNQNKTTVFALHHPLYSNGVHGGKYNFSQHLYPTQKKIPVPVLGSLVMQVRTAGGVSIQDLQNERYKSLIDRLVTIADMWGNVVFVSGHEHSIQYIEHEHIKQVVSGSGSKASYAGLSNDGLFAYGGQGFAVLDIFEDGSTWVSFYGSKQQKPQLLYQKEVFPKPEPVDLDSFPESFPQQVKAAIYAPVDTAASDLHTSIWGERYRELFGVEVALPVADLDTLYGGLEPMRQGGGHQTVSLRVKDSLDREYNFRRIRKNAVQFLQTVAFKDTPIKDRFENTLAEELIRDFYTASHPYAFLAVPVMADAIGVLHTNPEVYFLPKQRKLGQYNDQIGGEIYMIEERPEENWMGHESFGSPNHDIVSTEGMFDRLRRDEKYSVNEASYVKARIFDMLIGDWDRHNDQWRWAEIEDEEGNRVFEPIPRDRDQVFSNFDGAFFGTLRGVLGLVNQFGVYGEDINDLQWFNIAAIGLDRSLLQNVGKETWLEQAQFIQDNITDQVIERAFARMPQEVQGDITQELIEKTKGRRDNIVDIAMEYYDLLADLAIVTGTDKDDFIDVIRLKGGKTQVKITRNKGGERAEILSNKIYNKGETNEIWVYGLDDDDEFYVMGEGDDYILVRLIGGHGEDQYNIHNGKRLKVHDHKSLPNTFNNEGGARIVRSDKYDLNTYDKDKKIYKSANIFPGLGYNPDDGFQIGLQLDLQNYGFKRNPFTTRHTFGGGYYFGTGGYNLYYEGEFAQVWGDYNLLVGASYESPNFTNNFFGWGNETPNPQDELGKDYNRMRISNIGAMAGFARKSPFGSYFRFTANFEGVKVQDTEGRFITEEFQAPDPEFFDRNYYLGLDGLYRYESYDDELNPTTGMQFDLNLGGKMNAEESDRHFGYLKSYLSFYNAITRNRKLVLKSMARTHINFGDGYEFYHAAQLGDETGLRGYRKERFTGESYFAAGGDLRYSFDRFHTRLVPLQIGVFTGFDIGRVWLPSEDSGKWHKGYGGGFWINSAQALNGTFGLFKGHDEDWRFTFGFGLSF